MCGSQKGRWEKWKWGEVTNPLNLLDLLQLEEKGLATMEESAKTLDTHLFVCTSVIRSSNHQPEHRSPIFGGQNPFYTHAGSYKLCTSCPGAQLSATGLGMGDGQLLLFQELKLTKLTLITVQFFPWKLQPFNKSQNSEIFTSYRVCQWKQCLGGETDSWCLIFCHLPRIPSLGHYFGDWVQKYCDLYIGCSILVVLLSCSEWSQLPSCDLSYSVSS